MITFIFSRKLYRCVRSKQGKLKLEFEINDGMKNIVVR